MEVEVGGRAPAAGALCASRDQLTLDWLIKRVARQFLAKKVCLLSASASAFSSEHLNPKTSAGLGE
jgi:hypothetical protein